MKKITSKILLVGLALLSYKKNAFAQFEAPSDSGGLGGAQPIFSILINMANWFIFLFFVPFTIAMLFFYGGYFYLRNKKDTIKKEKAVKYFHRAKWFLVADAVLVVLYILLKVLDKWLESSSTF